MGASSSDVSLSRIGRVFEGKLDDCFVFRNVTVPCHLKWGSPQRRRVGAVEPGRQVRQLNASTTGAQGRFAHAVQARPPLAFHSRNSAKGDT